jgi:hypothetical protein
MGREITLGAHTYEVRPQKVGYLINRLGPKLQEALESEPEGIDGVKLVGAKAHEVLKVFIPDLMPVHEFLGYASHDAMLADDYGEATDVSPEPLQIKDAFKAASDVNGGEVLGRLKDLLGPVLTQRVTALLTARIAEASTSGTSPSSLTSQPTSGGSGQTSSSTPEPTPEPAASAA